MEHYFLLFHVSFHLIRKANSLNNIEYDNLISQIKLCNGILLQGSGACDNYEMIVAKYCYDNNIPTLGICCGQNVMVRALGGNKKPRKT